MTNRTNRCNKLSCSKITHEGIGMDGNMISTSIVFLHPKITCVGPSFLPSIGICIKKVKQFRTFFYANTEKSVIILISKKQN